MKKPLVILFSVLIIACSTGKKYIKKGKSFESQSEVGSINISLEKTKPPTLKIENIEFIDNNHNKYIDANESCFINFTLKNIGLGVA